MDLGRIIDDNDFPHSADVYSLAFALTDISYVVEGESNECTVTQDGTLGVNVASGKVYYGDIGEVRTFGGGTVTVSDNTGNDIRYDLIYLRKDGVGGVELHTLEGTPDDTEPAHPSIDSIDDITDIVPIAVVFLNTNVDNITRLKDVRTVKYGWNRETDTFSTMKPDIKSGINEDGTGGYLVCDSDKLGTYLSETAGVFDLVVSNINLNDIGEKSHNSLTNITNNQHIDNLTDIPTRNHNSLQNIGNNDHINNIIDIPNRDYKDLNSRGHANEDHTSTFLNIGDIKIEHDTVASNTERFTGGSPSTSEYDWVELEKIDVTNKYLGTVRLGVSFRLVIIDGTSTVYVRLKVDGNVVGSWSTSSDTYVERTVNIDYSDFNPTVTLEGKVDSDGGTCQVDYWGVWFDDLSDDDRYILT